MKPVHEREALKGYYQDDRTAEEYVATRFLAPRGRVIHETQVDLVNSIIADAGIKRALEIAPGPGRVTRDIKNLASGIALDASPQMLAEAAKVVDGDIWDLREGDAFDLGLGEKFSLIYSFRFIRHLEDDDRRKVLRVVREHLDEGGYFVFDAPNVVVELPIRREKPHLFPVYDKLWDRDELRAELDAAGLTLESLVGNMKWHGLQRVISKLSANALNGLGTMVVRAIDQVPGDNPLEWVVVCRG